MTTFYLPKGIRPTHQSWIPRNLKNIVGYPKEINHKFYIYYGLTITRNIHSTKERGFIFSLSNVRNYLGFSNLPLSANFFSTSANAQSSHYLGGANGGSGLQSSLEAINKKFNVVGGTNVEKYAHPSRRCG